MRACRIPNCVEPTLEGGYCARHKKQPRQVRHSRAMNQERLHTAAWKLFRETFLEDHPTCAMCGADATDCHHLTPYHLAGDQDLDPAKFAPLCKSCHGVITAQELRAERPRL